MKLYAFYYTGFGSNSFFVMAESEAEAREYIDKCGETDRDWPERYKLEVFSVGDVASHSNN